MRTVIKTGRLDTSALRLPYPHVDDVIPLMAEGKILPYLDIPLQHASPRILKLMKRPVPLTASWRALSSGAKSARN